MATSLQILTSLVIAVAAIQVAFATYTYYPPCDPPQSPEYGGYGPNKTSYTVGSKIKYYCNNGYKRHGASWTVCRYNKESYWTHPAPICKPIRCPDLDDPTYGSVSVSGYTFKSVANYSCDDGYKLYGYSQRKCLYGYWTGRTPVCKKIIQCPEREAPSYGSIKATGYRPGSTIHYTCKKGFKLIGYPWQKCLYNGKWSGAEPVCKSTIKCSDLNHPEYGSVNVTDYTPESSAHYKCDYGYKLVGDEYRECLYSGYWGGKQPVCKKITCPHLDELSYGGVNVSDYYPDSRAHYYCNKGYKLVGDAYRVCLYSGYWNNEVPVCKPIKCHELDEPTYGSVNVTDYSPDSHAYYYCKKGYKLVGDAYRVCLYSGYWNKEAPVCKPIKCHELDEPTYGSVNVTDYSPDSHAYYYCKKGYKLVGDAYRVCLYSGYWNKEAPVCKRITCHDLDEPTYGGVNVSSYYPDSRAHYYCNKGYKLVGDAYRVCLYSGYWNKEAPVCKRITCHDLDEPMYGGVNVSSYYPDSRAHYYCNKGYKLVGDAYRVCLYSGYWNKEAPVCKRITCHDLDEPTYGGVNVSSYYPDSRAHYYCNKGYKLVGDAYRVCLYSGYWNKEAPVCKRITCHDLDEPTYGGVNVSSYYPDSRAHYYCNKGYKLVGDAYRVCLYSGYWNKEAPVCKRITCHDLDEPTYGGVNVSSYYPDSRAHYYCNKGYKLVGDAYRVCLYSGYWNKEAPVCKRITCHDLDEPTYGGVNVSSYYPDSRAHYYCNKGYKLVGDAYRVCLYSGYWNKKAPVCKRITCHDLDEPTYGGVNISSYYPDSRAHYYCNKGYKLVGDAYRVCLYSGYWNKKAPVCKRITCHDLDEPAYGGVNVSSYYPDSRAHYYCNKGYKLVGDAYRVCLYSGYWNKEAPVCKRITCHDLDEPTYGGVNVSSYYPDSRAHYYCNKGYKLVGDAYRVCLYSGYWNGDKPTCKRITCPHLDDLSYGGVNVSDYYPDSRVHYYCNKGYKLVGDAYRVCLYSGYWNKEAPVCKPIKCHELDHPTYGSVNVTDYSPDSRAYYYCNKGYKRVGCAYRVCQYDGTWNKDKPVCKKITCSSLNNPTYGGVTVNSYYPDSRAHYYCNKGYKLVGDEYRVCLYSGLWDKKEPVCEKIVRCPHLSDPSYGSVNVTDYTPGSSAHYKCDYGYKLAGEEYRECLYNGYWGGKEPICKRISCPVLEHPTYGRVSWRGNTPKSKAYYRCNEGYELHGVEWRVCQYDGTWHDSAPTCQPIKKVVCPNLDAPDYGNIWVKSYTPYSIAYYSCNDGYKLKGWQYRKCLPDGTWYGSAPTCHPNKYSH